MRVAIGLLLLGIAFPMRGLMAQLTETDTLPFAYRISLQGNYLKGNVDRFLVLSSLDLGVVHEKWAIRSTNTYQFGSFSSFRTENDLLARQFFYLIPDMVVYPYLMLWIETNQRRQMNWRYQVGPGASWNVLDKKQQHLKLSGTITREYAQFKESDFVEDSYDGSRWIDTWRLTVRLAGQHQLADQKLAIRYEDWVQPALSDWSNRRLQANAAIRYGLKKRLAIQTQMLYSYEDVVVEGVESADLMVLFGLTFGNMP